MIKPSFDGFFYGPRYGTFMALVRQQLHLNKVSIYHFLKQQQLIERPLWVAVSGGLDSMVMLRLMLEIRASYGTNFSVFHAHHGLSSNADEWQHFVEGYCKINEVDCHSVKLNLNESKQSSLEQVARDARYHALSNIMPSNAVVLTGHHQLDQAETFLLRLLRSSGLRGLGAMKAVSSLPQSGSQSKQQALARPLLGFDQPQLSEYAKQHSLEWINDESNEDTVFDRNFIRHRVLPVLTKRWPHTAKAISQTTKLLQQDQALLEEYLQNDLRSYITAVGFGQIENSQNQSKPLFQMQGLNLNKLLQAPEIKQTALLKRFIEQNTQHAIGEKVLTEVFSSMLGTLEDRQPVIDLGEVELRTYKECLFVLKKAVFCDHSLNAKERFKLKRLSSDQLLLKLDIHPDLNPYTDTEFLISSVVTERSISEAPVELNLVMASNENKSMIRPNPRSGRKKVSELLKQNNCPAWLRHLVPVVVTGIDEKGSDFPTAIAVLGFGVHTKNES